MIASDVFTCRADNIVGFDEENTTIHICVSQFSIYFVEVI